MMPFDGLPFSFETETLEEINKAHVKIQNDGMPNLTIQDYSDIFRCDVIESLLHQIMEFPNNDNSSIVIRLAAHAAEWAEAKIARNSIEHDHSRYISVQNCYKANAAQIVENEYFNGR